VRRDGASGRHFAAFCPTDHGTVGHAFHTVHLVTKRR
jgi:hypothetical protein